MCLSTRRTETAWISRKVRRKAAAYLSGEEVPILSARRVISSISALPEDVSQLPNEVGYLLIRHVPCNHRQCALLDTSKMTPSAKGILADIVPLENLEMFEQMGSFFFHNSRRCTFLSRHSSQICLQSSIRALRSRLLTKQTRLCGEIAIRCRPEIVSEKYLPEIGPIQASLRKLH